MSASVEDLAPLSSYLLAYAGRDDDPAPPEGGFIASVAIVLRSGGESPEVLLIRRAESERDPWSGQIALPGGRRDDVDESLLHTAARETEEETGIRLIEVGRPLGRLSPVEPRTRRLPVLSVIPFVFAVPPDTMAAPSSPEVAEAFWSPLASIRSDTARSVHEFRAGDTTLSFPAFDLDGRVVWGMTHGILTELLGRIPDL
jgi:8-oxo-dGTP pyrophosphatase MutT (NUDIX family)